MVKMFVMAGQSNMAGRGPAEKLPERFREPPANVRFDYVCSFGASERIDPELQRKETGTTDPHRSSGWTRLRPAPRHADSPDSHFGPELGFGHELARRWPDTHLAIVKHGRGATNLAEDWAPDAMTGRRLYREMLDQIRESRARLEKEGTLGELSGFVWVQGEADTTRREWAEGYARNLTALIDRLRKDLDAPRLPVLIVLTGEGKMSSTMLFAETVRRAQREFVAADPCAGLVSGDDLGLLDGVHYDAEGQIELGQRLAEAYVGIAR